MCMGEAEKGIHSSIHSQGTSLVTCANTATTTQTNMQWALSHPMLNYDYVPVLTNMQCSSNAC